MYGGPLDAKCDVADGSHRDGLALVADEDVDNVLQRLSVALLLDCPAGEGRELEVAASLLKVDLDEGGGHWHAGLEGEQGEEGLGAVDLDTGGDYALGHVALGLLVDVLGGDAGPDEGAADPLDIGGGAGGRPPPAAQPLCRRRVSC